MKTLVRPAFGDGETLFLWNVYKIYSVFMRDRY